MTNKYNIGDTVYRVFKNRIHFDVITGVDIVKKMAGLKTEIRYYFKYEDYYPSLEPDVAWSQEELIERIKNRPED